MALIEEYQHNVPTSTITYHTDLSSFTQMIHLIGINLIGTFLMMRSLNKYSALYIVVFSASSMC